MKSMFPVSLPCRAAIARRLACAVRDELCCAIFLFGIGDRTSESLKTIAYGKVLYDALGRTLPSPPEMERAVWDAAVERIVNRFGYTALRAAASAA